MSDQVLPSKEHTFNLKDLKLKSPEYDEGVFTYQRANIRTRSEIGKTMARLNEGLFVDEETSFLHEMLSTLRHTLTVCPDWWEKADYGFDLEDLNLITGIYTECRKFDNEYVKKVWGSKPKKAKSEQSGEVSAKKPNQLQDR